MCLYFDAHMMTCHCQEICMGLNWLSIKYSTCFVDQHQWTGKSEAKKAIICICFASHELMSHLQFFFFTETSLSRGSFVHVSTIGHPGQLSKGFLSHKSLAYEPYSNDSIQIPISTVTGPINEGPCNTSSIWWKKTLRGWTRPHAKYTN